MREVHEAVGADVRWDIRDLDHRQAPSENELWNRSERVHGDTDLDWLRESACAGEDPELFFPLSPGDARLRLALAVCERCPVRSECLAAALRDPRTTGIWSGTTEWDRAVLRRH